MIGGYFGNGGSYNAPPAITALAPPFIESKDRVGALVTNDTRLEVGPTTTIDVRDNAIGETIGIIVQNQSRVNVVTGARIWAFEDSIGDSIGVVAEFDGAASIAGTFQLTEEGNGNAFGIIAEDSAVVDFSGTMTLSEEGNGNALPFHLFGDARLTTTGEFAVFEDGNADRVGALIEGRASAHLDGGGISIRSDGLSGARPIIFLELRDAAFVQITGGFYEVFDDDVELTPFMVVSGQSELRIDGHGFNRPYGAISDAAGDIAGFLADGQPFHVSFARIGAAKILLIPEPTAAALAVLGSIAAVVLRRRERVAGMLSRLHRQSAGRNKLPSRKWPRDSIG